MAGKSFLHAVNVAVLTFGISLVVSYLSGFSLGLGLAIGVLFLVILTGVIFDIIGTAVTAASEIPFHAMGADKVRGAKEAIYLIRNAARVANFCNDVVGDIAGTLSGALAAGIVLRMASRGLPPHSLVKASLIAVIAASTVGGKALGKSYAINQANKIIFAVGKVISLLKFIDTDLKRHRRKSRANSRKARKNYG